jgi:hypothetical protein
MIHSFPYSLRFENEWIIYSNSVQVRRVIAVTNRSKPDPYSPDPLFSLYLHYSLLSHNT